MVLVRTELGQLVMVPQQALAQAQAQNNLSPRPTTPTTGPSFRASGPQVWTRHRTPAAVAPPSAAFAYLVVTLMLHLEMHLFSLSVLHCCV